MISIQKEDLSCGAPALIQLRASIKGNVQLLALNKLLLKLNYQIRPSKSTSKNFRKRLKGLSEQQINRNKAA
jgi:hypothetical protein